MIPSISWKNIWRSKVRSLVVISAITLGLFGGLFCSAFFQGMAERRVKEALTKELAHIQIHHPKYLENPEIQFYIQDIPDNVEQLMSSPEVLAVSPRLKFNSMIASSTASSGVSVIGINIDQEKQVFDLHAALLTESEIAENYDTEDSELIEKISTDSVGSYFENVSRNPIFIGEELAHKLKIKVRSKVVLTFQNLDGSLTGSAFRVCGIYRTENSMYEEMNVFVKRSDIENVAGLPANTAHEITILLNDYEKADAVAESLQLTFPNLEVSDWKEIQPDIAMINDFMMALMTIIMIIVLLALGFGIVNTMMMVVLERVKEIGMLLAIGMNKARVFAMIILESVLLCLTGAAIGMGVSAAIIGLLGRHGLDMTRFVEEGFEAMGFGAVFYPTLSVEFYLFVTFLVIVTGVLSAVYPALKALRMNPADALRTE